MYSFSSLGAVLQINPYSSLRYTIRRLNDATKPTTFAWFQCYFLIKIYLVSSKSIRSSILRCRSTHRCYCSPYLNMCCLCDIRFVNDLQINIL